MNAITEFLYNVLAAITSVVNNYGVSIIIFTILMRLVCMPFDYKSRKGMQKVTKLQPKLNALQKKYGNDKQKFQQKQAELLRKEHYNPLSGCLPMLLTWPLMLAMFAAMRNIANEQLAMQAFRYLAGDPNPILAADRFLWVRNIWMVDSPFTAVAPDAASLSLLTKEVWQKALDSLSPEQLAAVTQSIAAIPDAVLDFATNDSMRLSVNHIVNALQQIEGYNAAVATVPGWTGLNFFIMSLTVYVNYNGYLILPVLAGLSNILQYKLTPQQDQSAQQPDGQKNSMGNFMKYFFPVLSVFFCLTSNAGFAVYWVTSNIVMTIQSFVITKILENQDKKNSQSVSGEGSVK